MNKTKVAIIGCGAIGNTHADAYRQDPVWNSPMRWT